MEMSIIVVKEASSVINTCRSSCTCSTTRVMHLAVSTVCAITACTWTTMNFCAPRYSVTRAVFCCASHEVATRTACHVLGAPSPRASHSFFFACLTKKLMRDTQKATTRTAMTVNTTAIDADIFPAHGAWMQTSRAENSLAYVTSVLTSLTNVTMPLVGSVIMTFRIAFFRILCSL